MRTTVMACLLVCCVIVRGTAAESCIEVLRGALRQTTDYVYRLTLSPGDEPFAANVWLLGPVKQPWYRVEIHEQRLSASVPWASRTDGMDEGESRYVDLQWTAGAGDVTIERIVHATSEAIYGAIRLPDPFPVSLDALPSYCIDALGATSACPSDDPLLAAFAEGLTAASATELDAVVRVLSWIRREIEYACSKDLCDPVYRGCAVYDGEAEGQLCIVRQPRDRPASPGRDPGVGSQRLRRGPRVVACLPRLDRRVLPVGGVDRLRVGRLDAGVR